MIAREKRAADLVFDRKGYPDSNRTTLAGNSQWSADHVDSDPIDDIVGAMEGMVVPPTHLLLGSAVWQSCGPTRSS